MGSEQVTIERPVLDGLVTASRDDFLTILRDGNGQNVLGVSNERLQASSGGEVPNTEGVVPRGRDGVVTAAGKSDIGDSVAVSVQALGGAANLLTAGESLPNDQLLVTRSRNKDLTVVLRNGELGNPVAVSLEITNVGDFDCINGK